ncbi:hypothetical protein TNCT_92971 [Trichonephila clavata]|uniref:Uncharacterized protein n=1 Tax=Trichonephila clavata TaxID=2740835 RepID=A0A8X6L8S0_TRICU|nr:hypothetical protein TNCT_92971 [Trichonephila clavata]
MTTFPFVKMNIPSQPSDLDSNGSSRINGSSTFDNQQSATPHGMRARRVYGRCQEEGDERTVGGEASRREALHFRYPEMRDLCRWTLKSAWVKRPASGTLRSRGIIEGR